ncbi:MAG: class I SAM-dependent methyltransferase [Sphingomicrobium sp.]|jgi:SAM-dependent methyltransferase
MKERVAFANSAETEAERIEKLCELALRPAELGLDQLDPFSPEYRELVLQMYQEVSGRPLYSPREHELSPYLDEVPDTRPNYYSAGTTKFAGQILLAMGGILELLDLKPGQKMLEYGSGEGGIALEAAKCGVDVTVVDIEPKYLGLIERRAKLADVPIRTIEGEFGHETGEQFDVVLFYEAFHHCLDHLEVARRIRGMLKPDGRLILAGEPVIGPHNEQWRTSVPYPWGLRMDGLSFRAIQTFGWLELGYDHDYLLEMLDRAGYDVEFKSSPATARADCYIARAKRPFGSQPERYLSHVGSRTEVEGHHAFRQAEGADGFLMYGPYEDLPVGSYEISAVASWGASDEESSLTLDMVSSAGASEHWREQIVPGREEGTQTVQCRFEISDVARGAEIRAEVRGARNWAITIPLIKPL